MLRAKVMPVSFRRLIRARTLPICRRIIAVLFRIVISQQAASSTIDIAGSLIKPHVARNKSSEAATHYGFTEPYAPPRRVRAAALGRRFSIAVPLNVSIIKRLKKQQFLPPQHGE
ncbi:MAG: hypothetical protein ABF868_09920 [Sporolactobacillus sp.]